jgi:hypothetical protein
VKGKKLRRSTWRPCAHYRLSTVDVKIYGEGAGPLEVVQRAITLSAERRRAAKRDRSALPPYEEAWCVFDREAANEPRGFRDAMQLAARHKIRLAISNPSFEYWYMLHYVDSNRPFNNGQELKAELRRYIAGYTEAMDVFHLLRERTTEAHDRANDCMRVILIASATHTLTHAHWCIS